MRFTSRLILCAVVPAGLFVLALALLPLVPQQFFPESIRPELLVDLRTKPETPCALEAEQSVLAEEMSVNTAQKHKCTPALVEVLRTRNGCLVRLTIGNRQFVTLSGRVELAQPVADMVLDDTQASHCTGYTITVGGYDE